MLQKWVHSDYVPWCVVFKERFPAAELNGGALSEVLMMWMDESGQHKPVDGSSGTLLKLHPDIRLNRLANWTCLLAVASIYVHSLLQLVHLHYWNGLSSGLDRVLEMVEGGGESWIMWKINTFEALELPGRRGVASVVKCPAFVFSLSLSLSLHVIVCVASASGCWCCGSSALGLCLTHMQLGNTHTHMQRPLHIHKQL